MKSAALYLAPTVSVAETQRNRKSLPRQLRKKKAPKRLDKRDRRSGRDRRSVIRQGDRLAKAKYNGTIGILARYWAPKVKERLTTAQRSN